MLKCALWSNLCYNMDCLNSVFLWEIYWREIEDNLNSWTSNFISNWPYRIFQCFTAWYFYLVNEKALFHFKSLFILEILKLFLSPSLSPHLAFLFRGRNNGQWMAMTGQILPFYRPEFSVIEMTGHFFLFSNWSVCWRCLESIRTTFKRMLRFFAGDNLITILCSVHIQLHQMIKPLLIDIKS